jgi:hypothetical protein
VRNRPTIASIRGELESLCRSIIPDLAGVPLYIVGTGTAPRGQRGRFGGAFALTGPFLDLAVRPLVEWQGRGAAIVINDAAALRLTRDWAAYLGRDFAEMFIAVANALVIHEAAHITSEGFYGRQDIAPPDGALERFRETVTVAFNEPSDVPECAFDGHGHAFIRHLLHVAHRASAKGYRFHWPCVASLDSYELSSLTRYGIELGDEPERMAGATFAELRAIPAPMRFANMWNLDCAAWSERRQKKCTSDLTRSAVAAFADRQLLPLFHERNQQMSTSTIDTVSHAIRTRAGQREEQYSALVQAFANGKGPAEDEVEKILTSSGRTIDQLERDVSKLRRRLELVEKMRQADTLVAERDGLQPKMDALDAKLKAAKDAHAQEHAPLYWRVQQINTELAQLQLVEVKAELRRISDPALQEKVRRLLRESRTVETSRDAVKDQQAQAEAAAADERYTKEDRDAAKKRVARHAQEVAELNAQRDALLAEVNAACAQMLEA